MIILLEIFAIFNVLIVEKSRKKSKKVTFYFLSNDSEKRQLPQGKNCTNGSYSVHKQLKLFLSVSSSGRILIYLAAFILLNFTSKSVGKHLQENDENQNICVIVRSTCDTKS